MRDFRTLRPREERHYVIAAVTLLDVDLSNLRRDLRALRDDLHGPVHYSEMTHSKRLHALEAASGFKDWDGFIFETSHPNERTERHVRDKLLRVALLDLVREQGVSKVTIESRNINRDEHVDRVNYGLDRHDAATLTSLRSRKSSRKNSSLCMQRKTRKFFGWPTCWPARGRTPFATRKSMDTSPTLRTGFMKLRGCGFSPCETPENAEAPGH